MDKFIYTLGSSNSAGIELADETVFDNYWDFLKIPEDEYRDKFPSPVKFGKYTNDIVDIYNKKTKSKEGFRQYLLDCKNLSYSTVLQKILNINVINHSHGGAGIDFVQHLYTSSERLDEWMIPYKNLKNDILNADLVIWEIPEEPRLCLTTRDHTASYISTNLEHLYYTIDNHMDEKLSKWKKKLFKDFYENVFDIDRFFREKMEFLNFMLLYRSYLKKPTIIFSFFNPEQFEEFDIINTKYTHNLIIKQDYKGMINQLVFDKKIESKETYCKFFHPSKRVHELTAKYFHNYIKEHKLL